MSSKTLRITITLSLAIYCAANEMSKPHCQNLLALSSAFDEHSCQGKMPSKFCEVIADCRSTFPHDLATDGKIDQAREVETLDGAAEARDAGGDLGEGFGCPGCPEKSNGWISVYQSGTKAKLWWDMMGQSGKNKALYYFLNTGHWPTTCPVKLKYAMTAIRGKGSCTQYPRLIVDFYIDLGKVPKAYREMCATAWVNLEIDMNFAIASNIAVPKKLWISKNWNCAEKKTELGESQGRRGGASIQTTQSMTFGSSGNRAGNSEDDEAEI